MVHSLKSKTLILGDQLFPSWLEKSPLTLNPKHDSVVMIEAKSLASRYRYHPLRLIHTFVAMREFRDEVESKKIAVTYFELDDKNPDDFFGRLKAALGQCTHLRVSEVTDRSFRAEIEEFCTKNRILLEVLPSPHFLCSREEFKSYLGKSKRPFMKVFYERERKRQGVMVDQNGNPDGGQWSFDVENRKKLPKGYKEPRLPEVAESRHEKAVRKMVALHFQDHPGVAGDLFLPVNRAGALKWLEVFLKERFSEFGPYEDSISSEFETLNHSLLSPLINLGLLSPEEVIKRAIEVAKKSRVAMPSLEGFVRQILGWREFIRGIDENFGDIQAKKNFFNHTRKLSPAWYEGTTGIPPLDDAIRRVNKNAYLHHIERLMIVSNLMLLCEVHPNEVHRWFMELFLDSYEWVMGPNVYGMGQMSDGGIFATKPYISGSNYILKMSDYTKGPWCEIWDGLYWSFIDRNRAFFSKNPRLSMMVKLLDKMPDSKRKPLFRAAEEFKKRVTV
jgi:deoxyribodipyrimidine photolyase-related protein